MDGRQPPAFCKIWADLDSEKERIRLVFKPNLMNFGPLSEEAHSRHQSHFPSRIQGELILDKSQDFD